MLPGDMHQLGPTVCLCRPSLSMLIPAAYVVINFKAARVLRKQQMFHLLIGTQLRKVIPL